MTLISLIKPFSLKSHFKGLILIFICCGSNLSGQNTDLDLIEASDGTSNQMFGSTISLSEDYLVVGAPHSLVGTFNNDAAIYIYSKDNDNNWGNEQKINTPGDGIFNWFGYSVSVAGNTIITGSLFDDEQANNAGAAYVYEVDGNGQWNFKQKLVADDATPSLFFGNTVYVSSDHIAVQTNGTLAGNTESAVYMFEKDNTGNWYFTQKIEPNTTAPSDSFGSSISMYGDYLVLGNPSYSESSSSQGAVHIYKKNAAGIWADATVLTAPDAMEYDRFGHSVSLYENTLVVGAPYTDAFGENSGVVYVYELDGNGNWNIEAEILAPEEQDFASFGISVQIHKNRFIVGAFSQFNLIINGAAYTYTRTGGGEWTAEETYMAFDTSPYDDFGQDVCLHSNSIAISARFHDGNGENSGAVYVHMEDCSFSLECPEALFIETNTGTCEGLTIFDDATLLPEIIDGCGSISIIQTGGPQHGEIASIGAHEITYEAISEEGISANCSFYIEVVDNEAPTASCQDLEFTLDPCEEIVILAEEVDFGSSDACGIASYNLSQTVFDETDIGGNPVELAVTDIHGNSATCNAIISIESAFQNDESNLIEAENITHNYGEIMDLTPSIAMQDGWVFSWYVDGTLYCEDCYSISISPESNVSIELTVQDAENCYTLTDALSIQLLVDYSVHIPTAFSPNYDGANDLFQAYFSDGVERAYELQVRDRWGNIVYHKKGEQIGWNGQFSGKEATPGIYTYALVFSLVNGVEVVETGDVCLVR